MGCSCPRHLDKQTVTLLTSNAHEKWFSVVSLWEIGVKRGMNRPDFIFDARELRTQLLRRGFSELALSGEDMLAIDRLPALHRDLFDRLLLCQALVKGLTVVTGDELMLQYPFPFRPV